MRQCREVVNAKALTQLLGYALRGYEKLPESRRLLRDLYEQPGIAETVNVDHIKRHYYITHDDDPPHAAVREVALDHARRAALALEEHYAQGFRVLPRQGSGLWHRRDPTGP